MSKLNNKFVILTAFYNSEDYIGRSIDGTLNQGFQDLGVIFINDASTDDSKDILFNKITGQYGGNIEQSGSSNVWIGNAMNKDIIYVENSTNVGSAALNQKNAVDNYISNTNTICGIVDGDDFLHHGGAVSWAVEKMGQDKLMYASTQHWRSNVGTKNGYALSNKLLSQDDFPDIVIDGVTYPGHTCPPLRTQGWAFQHFRAFKKVLSDNVITGRSFVNPTGGLIKAGSDVAYFKPMIDMAGTDRIVISRASHYTYTYDSPLNDHHIHHEEQNRNAKFCTYNLSGVDFVTGDDLAVSGFCTKHNLQMNYVTGSNINFSGIANNKSGYFIFDRTTPNSPDGTITCATPYDRLSL